MPKKESNIRKRKDGRWEARYICGKKPNGQSQYRSLYGKTYCEVREKRRNILLKKENDKTINDSFTNVSYEWLKSINIKESTYAKYHYVIDKYLAFFNCFDIKDIDDNIINTFLSQTSHYSGNTMKLILTVLKMIMKYAMDHHYSVHCHMETLSIKTNKNEVKYISYDEQVIIENTLFHHDEPYTLGIWIGLYAGLRIGEVCALKWQDIDISSRIIHIRKTIQRIANHDVDALSKTKIIIGEPKSQNSIRDVPIPECCYEMIVDYYQNNDDCYLLTGTSKYMEPRLMEHHFSNIMHECQLKDIHFHTLRHTFTTRCIEQGFDMKTLSELLGHNSVSFTLDKYGHSSMETKKNNMNKLQLVSKRTPH